MRRALTWTAAVLAAVFVFLVATLPPAPTTTTGAIDEGLRRRTLPGAYHIHSIRSDGVGDRDAIAAAAARAGLQFVIITDHGDATRPPDPPAYLHGVLCLDAVEISTNGGHYVALDMSASPYPLAGDPEDVVEDVRRLGGFGIAAHPDSPKASLRWTESLPIDGFEWLNLDSEWRDESTSRLARTALDYFFRPGPALASVLDRPKTLDRLNEPVRRVALAGHDAHGGWAHRAEDGDRQGILGIPSYEGSFRTFAVRVILDRPPSGAAAPDGRALFDAIRAGRVFSALDAVAAPAFVDFHVERADAAPVAMGQRVRFVEGMSLVLRSSVPSGGKATLLRGGEVLAESRVGEIRQPVQAPRGFAVDPYRVEVSAPTASGSPPMPWLVSNPIYVAGMDDTPRSERPVTFAQLTVVDDAGSIEKDSSSTAALRRDGDAWILEYELGAGERVAQYAALSVSLPQTAFNALRFDAQTTAPARVSVQLRFNKYGGVRYGRTVYLTPDNREITLSTIRMKPIDGHLPVAIELASATSVLFVVDLTHANPGQKGTLRIGRLTLGLDSGSVSPR
jgi:hypothetical protein